MRCLWQQLAKSNQLEITKIEFGELSDRIVKTARIFKQLQPGTWKIPNKRGSEELMSLFWAL